MHTCPQVFLLLCEAGCLPMDGIVYHTYASALWGLANQAAPVCTHVRMGMRTHKCMCVCPTYPLYTCSTHTLYAPLPCKYI